MSCDIWGDIWDGVVKREPRVKFICVLQLFMCLFRIECSIFRALKYEHECGYAWGLF